MTISELQEAIKAKAMDIETAIEAGKPHEELNKIYKELKELQYQKMQIEMGAKGYRIE